MNTLVLYTGKRGATARLAQMIAGQIPGAVCRELADGQSPSVLEYDCVILGSSLTAGKIGKQMRAFVEQQRQTLVQKRLGLFLSGLDRAQEKLYFRGNFPAELLAAARAARLLGGVYDPEKCGALTRLLLKKAAGVRQYTDTIDEQDVRRFVQELCV